jgi:hypothetical protein
MKNKRLNAEVEKGPQTIDGPRRTPTETGKKKSKGKNK